MSYGQRLFKNTPTDFLATGFANSTVKSDQQCGHFVGNIFKCTFLKENSLGHNELDIILNVYDRTIFVFLRKLI